MKKKKTFHVQEQWSFSLSSSGVIPSASILVLVFKQYLCHSLAMWLGQETSFMNRYLPYFGQWLICCLLSPGYFCRLCLLIVCLESCSSPLLWWRGLSAGYFCRLCLLKVCRRVAPPSPMERLVV
jgi:hypothetical protein